MINYLSNTVVKLTSFNDVFSKPKWCFSVYNISKTCVAENIDNEINRYYRKWLQIPISGNITHLSLPKKMLGYNIKTAQNIHAQCKLSVRRILKMSRNEEVRTLYNLTNSKNVESDFILNSTRVPEIRQIKQHSTKALSKQTNESTWNGFLNLNEQSGIIRSLVEQFPENSLIKWQNVTSKLPDNIIKFSRRCLIYSLSNSTNLQKWKQNDSQNCLLCSKKETNFICSTTVKQL